MQPFGNVPDLSPKPEVPTLGEINFKGIEYRFGTIQDDEGNTTGLVQQFWFPYMPWLKFQIPYSIEAAIKLVANINDLLNELADSTSNNGTN